ncbi:hypothetical protein DUD79_21735 [Priestia aryabhattai]|jgi:hypothetical protein
MVNVAFTYLAVEWIDFVIYQSLPWKNYQRKKIKKILSDNVPVNSFIIRRILINAENFLFFVFLVWTFT